MVRTFMLMAAMTALLGLIGGLLGGGMGIAIALLFALFMNGTAYWNSDKLVLSMHGAKRVSQKQMPALYAMVDRLSQRAGLPMPALYVIEQGQANAFATGRNPQNAAVAATTGLLRTLSEAEIEGVMAHELAHIKNRDTLTMTITATLAGAISMLANFAFFFGNNRNNPLGLIGTIAVMILAPIAAALVQMAISRSREYEADKLGAEISGNPRGLASALSRLARQTTPNPQAEKNPASAHLFITNPLRARNLEGLFSTHPPMAERIRRLDDMAGRPEYVQPADRFERYRSDPDRYRSGSRGQSGGRSGIPDVGDTSDQPSRSRNPWR